MCAQEDDGDEEEDEEDLDEDEAKGGTWDRPPPRQTHRPRAC